MQPHFFQHQLQKQILSPQIRQYLKLLQLPLAELSQAIEAEMAENPLLEEAVPSPEELLPEPEQPENRTEELEFEKTFEQLGRIDEDFSESFSEASGSYENPEDLEKKHSYQETLLTQPEALADFLLWQIRLLDLSEAEKKIAEEIIGNIDDDGYLKASVDEITTTTGAGKTQVERMLSVLQTLDPPGIGARNLQEALILQLKKKGLETTLAMKIVTDHLPLLERRDFSGLAKACASGIQEIKQAFDIITRLDPKPGRSFYSGAPTAVTPDASVSFSEDDEKLKIEIHEETIPELRLNAYYRKLLRSKDADEKTKEFLREKMQRAINFIKALSLRKSTLREITEEIVRVQTAFFEKGFSQLVPLRLKDVAEKIGIHESTVSRAIQGKYITTPQGTIPYKSFFSNKLETLTGEAESQKSIMEKIKSLIEKEPPNQPLSDQDIAKELTKEGVVIARRTVAKYREMLKILPSHMRRQR